MTKPHDIISLHYLHNDIDIIMKLLLKLIFNTPQISIEKSERIKYIKRVTDVSQLYSHQCKSMKSIIIDSRLSKVSEDIDQKYRELYIIACF